METRNDFKESLELCNKHKIEYRIVGGYALGPDADAARRMYGRLRCPPVGRPVVLRIASGDGLHPSKWRRKYVLLWIDKSPALHYNRCEGDRTRRVYRHA